MPLPGPTGPLPEATSDGPGVDAELVGEDRPARCSERSASASAAAAVLGERQDGPPAFPPDRVFPAFATYRRQAAEAHRTIPLVELTQVGEPPTT